MARYRIAQRPSYVDPTKPVFTVERKVWFWWEDSGLCLSLDEAMQRIVRLRLADMNPVKTMVVKEYDQ
jgi:hypothetical protein